MDSRLTLEKRIEAEIMSYDGKMGIYLDDFHGNVIAVHADEAFETASTIKTYILACLFDEVEKGKKSLEDIIEYKEEHVVDGSGVLGALEPGVMFRVKDAATFMIIVSDNIATNMMIDYLGAGYDKPVYQNSWLQEIRYCYNPLHFERYDGLGTSTPRDYASIFTRLAKGKLISPKADEKMLGILKKQHYNSMITKDFPPFYMDSDNTDDILISVASKSGSMDACRNDGGLVFTPLWALCHRHVPQGIF
jgi:beta-lactamase class A